MAATKTKTVAPAKTTAKKSTQTASTKETTKTVAPAKTAAPKASKAATAKETTKTTKVVSTTPEKPAKAAPKKVVTTVKATPVEKPTKKPLVNRDISKICAVNPIKKPASAKTVYHVSKRDNDGREWKVFIRESDKVIKLFDTQLLALDYAKSLAANKKDGSYVVLHGLDGKIRKF